MAAKPHNALNVNAHRAVRPFRRKVLLPAIKAGTVAVRVIGSKGTWHLYAQRGRTLHRLTGDSFITQTQATLRAYAMFKTKATVYKSRVAA